MSKKNSTAKSAPKQKRRSGSQFTTPLDAYLVRDDRPTSITWNEKSEQYDVRVNGRKVGSASSMSSARRLRYRKERDLGFKVQARKLASLRKQHEKQRGAPEK